MVAVDGMRVVMVTEDDCISEVVLRHAAVVGLDVLSVSPSALTRAIWAPASLVLIGSDAVEHAALLGLGRRTGVIVVAASGVDEHPLWRLAVEIGAEHVVALPLAEAWLLQRLSQVADGPSRDGCTIVVTSASGGSGVSTLAYGLAAIATQDGRHCALIDADRHGGGLDLLLGGEHAQGVRWPDLAHTQGRLSATTLSYALPKVQGMSLLSHSRTTVTDVGDEAMASVLDAARRGFDRVVVDLPRLSSGPAIAGADAVVLVVPATLRGIAGARQALVDLQTMGAVTHVVTRRTARGLAISDVQRALAVNVVHPLPEVPRLAIRAEHGDPFEVKDAFGRAVGALSRHLVDRTVAA